MAESQPFCYPVCLACQDAPCPQAFTPAAPRKARTRHVATPANTLGERLACGCREDVPAVWRDFGPRVTVFCPRHGWQKLAKNVKVKAKDTPNPNQEQLPDIPPF